MARRPKWLDRRRGKAPAWLSKHRPEALGYSQNPVDWNPNLDPNRVRGEWVAALMAADSSGDLSTLVALLEAAPAPSADELRHLADLLKRVGKLTKKRGGRITPSYDMTDAEKTLSLAIGKVRERAKGVLVAAALERASKQFGIPAETLENAYYGRRASSRRIAKRRP